MVNFSERFGYKPIRSELGQYESMDAELKTAIWNFLYEYCLDYHFLPKLFRQSFYKDVWLNCLKRPLDQLPGQDFVWLQSIHDWYDSIEWHEVYSFLEFCIGFDDIDHTEIANRVLEQDGSAYRIVHRQIVPITNGAEITVIEEAASLGNPYLAAANHIQGALALLADHSNPSPGNIVKEAISAVESAVEAITGEEIIKGLAQLGAHSQLEQAWKNMYHWTSQEPGVRHGTGKLTTVGIEEARYMVVASSAFMNYLVNKNS